MKLYEVIVDDGKVAFKTKLTAKNKKDLKNMVVGDIVKCVDITDIAFITDINTCTINECCDYLVSALYGRHYGENEVLILRALLKEFLEKRNK